MSDVEIIKKQRFRLCYLTTNTWENETKINKVLTIVHSRSTNDRENKFAGDRQQTFIV